MSIPIILKKILDEIAACGARVKTARYSIIVDCGAKNVDFMKIKPFLYYLLNHFEQRYFILIRGIPYCLMPDCAHHFAYRTDKGPVYIKNRSCAFCKYDAVCPGLNESLLIKSKPQRKYVPDFPEEIALEITQRCNLDCCLCFKEKTMPDMPFAAIKKVIDESVSLGIKDIRFTGGEPSLHPCFNEALAYAKAKNCYVTVNTNAAVLHKSIEKIYSRYVDNVLISLQGFNTAIDTKLTGSHLQFSQKIANILKFKKIVPVVRLGTIISKILLENRDKYLTLIKKMGITHWELYRPMADKPPEEFIFSKKALLNLMQWMRLVKIKSNINVMIFNPVPFCVTNDPLLSSYTLFGALRDDGHTRLVCDGKGFRPSYSIKKYCGSSIKEAWNSPFLKKMRAFSYLPQKCRRCFYLVWCKGGSRYMAYIANNTFFAPDPLMPVKGGTNH